MRENPLKRGVLYLKASSSEIQAQYSTAASRTLHLAGISGVGNIFLGLGKIVSGALSLSVFACVNGFFTPSAWCWPGTAPWPVSCEAKTNTASTVIIAGQA